MTLRAVAHQAPLSWDFPGKNTGVGCHFFLQGIFLAQELNPLSPVLIGALFTAELPEKPLCESLRDMHSLYDQFIKLFWYLFQGSNP